MKQYIRILFLIVIASGLVFSFKYLKNSHFKSENKTLYIVVQKADIRSGNDSSHSVLTSAKKGSKIQSLGYLVNSKGYKWYLIKLPDKKQGWVKSGDVTITSPVTLSKFTPNVVKTQQPKQALLDVPLIQQLPELPRGCEVTSLAMMMQYAGVNVDKMKLASQVKKDTTPYRTQGGTIYFGNPNAGFVGDMYSLNKPGYGVYHTPIEQLAKTYLPGKIIDFTGSPFESIYTYLDKGTPVWVIINALYDTVPQQDWETWQTPSGPIQITMEEHSVLITGYDNSYIYYNDPLVNSKNQKVEISKFKNGWEQMGKQAITYLK